MLVGRLHTALAEIAVDVSAPILKFDSGMTYDCILLEDSDEDKNANHGDVASTLLVHALHFSQ